MAHLRTSLQLTLAALPEESRVLFCDRVHALMMLTNEELLQAGATFGEVYAAMWYIIEGGPACMKISDAHQLFQRM
eukprot:m.250568 g.250568  ORF g.250568 m.250568 type:complete len:76 (-) comp16771_c0_seq1:100-327(-)